MAESPNSTNTDLVSFSIMIEGKEIPGSSMVTQLEVKKEVNKVPTATFTVLDGDRAKLEFPISESDDFKPGKKVKITAGYHQKEETIFEGVIVSHGLRLVEDNFS